ncbi:MAG: porin [Burkholderiaceae bacterium]
MKKSLLALAVLSGFSGIAAAQTSIVLYGTIDGAVRRETSVNNESRIRMRDGSNFNSNRIGFRGTEDLGAGMNAHFVLESGFFSGTGQQTPVAGIPFDRLAFVGLTTGFGTLDLGRVYGPQFYAALSSDPMEAHFTGVDPLLRNSVSASQTSDNYATSNSRTDNALLYTNKIGDLTVRGMYAFGETANSVRNGSTTAIGAVYQTPVFSLDAAYTRKKLRADYNSNALAGLFGNDAPLPGTVAPDYQTANYYTAGSSYTIGALRGTVGFSKEDRAQRTRNHTQRVLWAGLRYNFTPLLALSSGYFKEDLASFAGNSRKNLFMLGSTYSLSKRTTLFAEIDHSNYRGPQAPNDPIGQFLPVNLPLASGGAVRNGYMVGVSHAF